jgi:hypothetical protein
MIKEDQLNNFFINGYVHGTLTDKIELDYFDQFNFIDCSDGDASLSTKIPKEAKDKLMQIHKLLGENIISLIFPNFEYKECSMWSNVDSGSSVWHNDFLAGSKTFNSNILVYLDDTFENENCIEVRNQTNENKLFPRRGDFVWLNQQNIFEHKATYNKGSRRVLSFEYYIDGLNN